MIDLIISDKSKIKTTKRVYLLQNIKSSNYINIGTIIIEDKSSH